MWGYIIWECILWGYKVGRYIICRLMFMWELFIAHMLAMLASTLRLMMKVETPAWSSYRWLIAKPKAKPKLMLGLGGFIFTLL